MAGLLILAFSVFFLVTFIDIVRRDYFFAGIYFFLFVYTIFAQIGYVYFPDLANLLGVYSVPEMFYGYNIFLFLSFLSFYLIFKLFYGAVVHRDRYTVVKSKCDWRIIFYIIVIVHFIFSSFFFLNHYELLNYVTFSSTTFFADKGVDSFIVFVISFKFSVYINFILYYCYRLRYELFLGRATRLLILAMLVVEFLLFILIAQKIGNRLDVLVLMLAIVSFEVNFAKKIDFKKVMKLGFLLLLFLLGALFIEHTRGVSQYEFTFFEKIILKDYLAPSYVLIAAMEFGYVSFLEVFRSNLSNMLLLMDYPYLQATVMEFFMPGVATRSSSYAFYVFTEGYIAMGFLGFVYNGIVLFLYAALWRNLACSNNRHYNLFMLSLISSQFANISRCQTSYFIKDIYMWFIPAAILLYLLIGLYPNSLRKPILNERR